ncbi:16S rRNA (guanine(527)-N(7))-methyltransferase RsmG [Shimia ponticola]|uniref:16S rRNA (guanine(527)-N(7))-methyltransferase RsmG n=1 Tax=Shimia ponticola TaxID=2582893 RepID=UPI0011BED0D2|nr:16S rRNA (guanine(527)-N(7))-methyltransferase RsmG [Shimia ponticola]
MRLEDVSRETKADLEAYVALLLKWNNTINLVAKSTEDEIWTRHIEDSLQIWPILPDAELLVDMGSGGGLPGIVLAICAKHDPRIKAVTLIEADIRKSTFLQTVIRDLGLPAKVLSRRISECPPLNAQLVTARALSDLASLLGFCDRHLAPGGTAVFPKGARADEEIETAENDWRFAVEKVPSATDPNAVILKIGDIARV